MQVETELSQRFHVYRKDPKVFCRQMLGQRFLWSKQVEILEAIRDHKYIAVPSGHMLGKSYTASLAAWWFKSCFRPSKVIVTAPGSRNVDFQTAAEIRKRYENLRARFTEAQLATLQMEVSPKNNRWMQGPDEFMLWFTTKKDQATEHATRMAGFHADHMLFIFDEAGAIDKAIWEGIEGSLMQEGRKLLAIGNPSDPTSAFAAFCRRPDVKVIRLNTLEFPNVVQRKRVLPYGPDYKSIEDFRLKAEGTPRWYFKILGLFPPQASDSLISYDAIGEVLTRLPKAGCAHMPGTVGVGVDIARFGDDETVVFALCACGQVLEIEHRQGHDTMVVTGLALEVLRRIEFTEKDAKRVAVDETGVGGGVVDRLHEKGWDVRGVNFGSKALSTINELRFRNRRTELWWMGREWLRGEPVRKGGLKPAACVAGLPPELADILRDELTSPKYKINSDETVILESKKEIKKRLGKSPDFADALMLAISVLPRYAVTSTTTKTDEKHDPYWERDFGEQDELDGYTPGRKLEDIGAGLADW